MQIDGNQLAIRQNQLDQEGLHQEAMQLKKEFLRQVRESGDHCPCKEKCPHHGNCFECVTLHRGIGTICLCVCGIWSMNGSICSHV